MTHSIPDDASHPVRGDAKSLIESSGLPAEAQKLIADVVKRTRLWKREKAEVAMEFIAHFQDGLEAGRSAQDLIATFGDVKTSARLIRRGKKRNRSLWWRMARRMQQAIALFILAYLGSAALLSLRHPQVTVDYLAELNRPIEAIPPTDCAWPIYRKAWVEGRIWDVNFDEVQAKDEEGNDLDRMLRPDDADWPRAVAFLDKHRVLLNAARAGGMRPGMGLPIRPRNAYGEEDSSVLFPNCRPESNSYTDQADQLLAESALCVLLPQLSHMRTMGGLLTLDMRRAAREGDGERALADCHAILGLARQTREQPLLINQIVALHLAIQADTALAEINSAQPSVLAAHRIALVHEMAAAESLFSVDFSGESMVLRDMIQRIYSDNGSGDGMITLDGLHVIQQMVSHTSGDRAWMPLVMPAAATVTASRKELTEQTDLLFRLAEYDASRPFWERLHQTSASCELEIQWKTSPAKTARLFLLCVLAPALDPVMDRSDEAKALHEATMVALALEAYRDEQGHYPASLAEMVPQYLPKLPLDYSTGGPLQYKQRDGKARLYGLGKDGKDDGGVWTDKKARYPRVPSTGDWVLYPPAEQQ